MLLEVGKDGIKSIENYYSNEIEAVVITSATEVGGPTFQNGTNITIGNGDYKYKIECESRPKASALMERINGALEPPVQIRYQRS